MTRVALLADAHGNLPALEAVLSDAVSRGAGQVWYLGDFTGYGPHPDAVVRLLSEQAQVAIRGNYDRKVLRYPRKRARWRRDKHPDKLRAFQFAYENLSEASLDYLRSLPDTARALLGPLRALLVHGSPDSDSEALGEDTPPGRWQELARETDADIIAHGHTHRSGEHRLEGVTFVNPGSVGRPEGDPRASYALLDIQGGELHVAIHQVAYDIERTVRDLRRADLPETFAHMLRQGRNLDQVEARSGGAGDEAPAQALVRSADQLARRYDCEMEHVHQVTVLACRLFDQLAPPLGLADEDRERLRLGALLHDVGLSRGAKGHHKASRRIIMDAAGLALPDRDRRIVACIARYHRKALPRKRHAVFGRLDPADRQRVELLAGILRVADGLDRSHQSAVQDVQCRVRNHEIVIDCHANCPARAEHAAAERKGNLLQRATGRTLKIRMIQDAKATT